MSSFHGNNSFADGKEAKAAAEEEAAPAGNPSDPRPRPRRAPVDWEVPDREAYQVYGEYHCMLNLTSIQHNNNKYYIIQVLEKDGAYACWTRWGRVGERGQNNLERCDSANLAIQFFEKKFKDKTKNDWAACGHFKEVEGNYMLVLTENAGEGRNGDVPLGKLSKSQIEKGKAVLDKIEKALMDKDLNSLPALSSEFYSLIPHNFGRQRPEAIDTLDKVNQLKVLLGLEDLDVKDKGVAPISGSKTASETGTIVVKVLRAKGFTAATDAYVKVEVEEGVPKMVKTQPIKASSEPVWNEEFTIEVQKSRPNVHELWLHIKDAHVAGGRDIGYCKFPYGDEAMFPSGQMVSIRDHKVDHDENKTTEALDVDITVTWNHDDE